MAYYHSSKQNPLENTVLGGNVGYFGASLSKKQPLIEADFRAKAVEGAGAFRPLNAVT
jgi:hypothetical protein